jgi:hypothetical protein
MDKMKVEVKNAALNMAWQIHNHFNRENKPSSDEVLEDARKFEAYLTEQ